jgi:hypothetical protein
MASATRAVRCFERARLQQQGLSVALKGHGFSRAINAVKSMRASAPEGCFHCSYLKTGLFPQPVQARAFAVLSEPEKGTSIRPGKTLFEVDSGKNTPKNASTPTPPLSIIIGLRAYKNTLSFNE